MKIKIISDVSKKKECLGCRGTGWITIKINCASGSDYKYKYNEKCSMCKGTGEKV